MSDDKKPRIRPVSRSQKKAKRLQECRCLAEVDRRLRLGWSSYKIADYIQHEANELSGMSNNYVRKLVDDYRKMIPPTEIALSSQNHSARQKANARTAAGIEELDELEKLYQLQMKRIKIDVENEEKINKLLPTTGREIFYAMKLLKQSSDLKMDLGLATRQLGEVSVTGAAAAQISDRYNNNVGQVLADPDSRRKVLGFVETLMSVANKAHIDAGDLVASAVTSASHAVIDVEYRDSGDEHRDSDDDDNKSED